MRNHKILLATVVLMLVSLGLMSALGQPGFYTSHDGWHIVARLFHFDQAVRDGQIPPRWSGGLLTGFGYPLFIFSYHLPWWLAEPLVLIGFSIFDAIKSVFVLTYILSGLAMFFWIRSHWGSLAGMVSALIYLVTPYRFATILVRANMGEAVSFAFVPFIFWALSRLDQKKFHLWLVVGAIGIAGSLLSHVMVTVLFALPVFLWVLVTVVSKSKKVIYLMRVGAMFILGFGLAAYYLVPAVYYKPLTVFAERYHGLYREHFTPLAKLIYSPWGYGALGTDGEMSRQVGVIIWLIIMGTAGWFIFSLARKRGFIKNIDMRPLVFLVTFTGALFLMVRGSLPLWKMIEDMAVIDFPWRFLAVTTFSGSVLAGWLVDKMPGQRKKLILVLLLVLGALYTNRNHLRVNQYTDIPLSLYVESELTTNTDDEYLPRWVDREAARKTTPLINSPTVTVSDIRRQSNKITFAYTSAEQNNVAIHHMYFPGWNLYIDGVASNVSKGDGGGMAAQLMGGSHRAELKYLPTPIMRLGEILTISSLLAVFGLFSRFVNSKRSRIVR